MCLKIYYDNSLDVSLQKSLIKLVSISWVERSQTNTTVWTHDFKVQNMQDLFLSFLRENPFLEINRTEKCTVLIWSERVCSIISEEEEAAMLFGLSIWLCLCAYRFLAFGDLFHCGLPLFWTVLALRGKEPHTRTQTPTFIPRGGRSAQII